jgi:hypothetical protein
MLIIPLISGCVTQAEIYDSHAKGGHPSGKHNYKVKHYEKRKK